MTIEEIMYPFSDDESRRLRGWTGRRMHVERETISALFSPTDQKVKKISSQLACQRENPGGMTYVLATRT
jgi:hypothetical protein